MSAKTDDLVKSIISNNIGNANDILRQIFVQKIKDRVYNVNESFDVFSEEEVSQVDKNSDSNQNTQDMSQDSQDNGQTEKNDQKTPTNKEDLKKIIKNHEDELKKDGQELNKIVDDISKNKEQYAKCVQTCSEIMDGCGDSMTNLANKIGEKKVKSLADVVEQIGKMEGNGDLKKVFDFAEKKTDLEQKIKAVSPKFVEVAARVTETANQIKQEANPDGQINESGLLLGLGLLGSFISGIFGLFSALFSVCLAHPILPVFVIATCVWKQLSGGGRRLK